MSDEVVDPVIVSPVVPDGPPPPWVGEILAELERPGSELYKFLVKMLHNAAVSGGEQAIQLAGVLTEATVYKSQGLYERLKETDYESAYAASLKAIKDSGIK